MQAATLNLLANAQRVQSITTKLSNGGGTTKQGQIQQMYYTGLLINIVAVFPRFRLDLIVDALEDAYGEMEDFLNNVDPEDIQKVVEDVASNIDPEDVDKVVDELQDIDSVEDVVDLVEDAAKVVDDAVGDVIDQIPDQVTDAADDVAKVVDGAADVINNIPIPKIPKWLQILK